MLDEREYEIVVTDQMKNAIRELAPLGLVEKVQPRTLELMSAEYERLTGFRIADPWHIFRHTCFQPRPLCKKCGKPLRTPRAKLCGSCMAPVDSPDSQVS